MFDAAAEPVAAVQPDPNRAEPTRPVPSKIARVLSLVDRLAAYGQNLADSLQQHAAAPHILPFFAFLTWIFGTRDLALILARIRCGLLRVAALEARLRRRAARGPDLQSAPRRPRSPCKPRPAKPATPPAEPAQAPALDRLPTPDEIEAQVRRRPIGAVLVDICLDLGIAPAQMDDELKVVLIGHGGSSIRLMFRNDKQRPADPTEASPNLSDSPGHSPSFAPIPITGPLVFPPWPARSPQSPSSMSSDSSRECTGPP
jgi:hypothetical protein